MQKSIELLHKNYIPLNHHVPISDTCCAMIYKLYENQFIDWLENVNKDNVNEIAHFVLGICECTLTKKMEDDIEKMEKEAKKKEKKDKGIKYNRKKNNA